MSVRIEKDGWIVTGDTLDELELGIEAVQRALSKTRGNGLYTAEKRGPGRPRTRGVDALASERQRNSRARAIQFMRAILDAGNVGVAADVIAEKTGAKSKKGIGIVVSAANRVLADLPVKAASAYRSERNTDGRRWFPGPKLAHVLAQLEEDRSAED